MGDLYSKNLQVIHGSQYTPNTHYQELAADTERNVVDQRDRAVSSVRHSQAGEATQASLAATRDTH